MNKITNYLFSILFLIAISCQKNNDPDPVLNIPTEVQPYIDAFVAEAKKRGLDIKIDNLIVEFVKDEGDFVCGRCKNLTSRQKNIVLTSNPVCWKDASAQSRESLVFHELGHCYLSRNHKSTKFADGSYTSLMNPDDVDTYSICQYVITGNGKDCDKRPRRQYYIDELFDENTPIPFWAK